jgi:hypothetical protein
MRNLRKSSKKKKAAKKNQDLAIEMMSGGVKGKTFFTKDSATIKIQKWVRKIQAKKKA